MMNYRFKKNPPTNSHKHNFKLQPIIIKQL